MKKALPWIALHVIFLFVVLAAWLHLDHLYQVRGIENAANSVHESMSDLESAQRGYLLDGDVIHLNDYNYNRKILIDRLDYLCSLIPKTKENADICLQLGKLVEIKMDEMQSTIDAEKSKHHSKAIEIFKSNAGMDYRNEIDKLVNAIKVEHQTQKMPGCLIIE